MITRLTFALGILILFLVETSGLFLDFALCGSGPDLQQLYESAESAFEQQQWDRAEKLFEQVLCQTYLSRGQLRRNQGRFRDAVEDLEWAHKLDPANPQTNTELGLARLGDEQSGRSGKEKMTPDSSRGSGKGLRPSGTADPCLASRETMCTRVLANSHNRLGLMAAERKQFEEAVTQFARVASLQSDFPRVNFNLGLAVLRAQRLPEAIRAPERALTREPSDSEAGALLGLSQFEHGDLAEALPNLERVEPAHADDPGFLLAFGSCLVHAHRTVEAQAVFKRLLELHSNRPELHVLLGRAAYAQGNTPDAEAELQNALTLDPNISQANFYLGMMALDHGDLPAAETHFEAELQSHPEDQKAAIIWRLSCWKNRNEGGRSSFSKKYSMPSPAMQRRITLSGRLRLNRGRCSAASESLRRLCASTRTGLTAIINLAGPILRWGKLWRASLNWSGHAS